MSNTTFWSQLTEVTLLDDPLPLHFTLWCAACAFRDDFLYSFSFVTIYFFWLWCFLFCHLELVLAVLLWPASARCFEEPPLNRFSLSQTVFCKKKKKENSSTFGNSQSGSSGTLHVWCVKSQFELRQVIPSRTTSPNALNRCRVIGWDVYIKGQLKWFNKCCD